MTRRTQEKAPSTIRRSPAATVTREPVRRPTGGFGELLVTASVACGLCLVAARPDLREAVVHLIVATAAGPPR
ncbi:MULTISPECIES: hypothetical protein [Streptomyces]|uniref:Lipoprotein n=2 Tax=Streptomyces TaxID=1883 RepID=A0ABU4KIZ0_9ACTN|nr:hypothetical protein [Streptomyces roseolus]MDX2297302.1 hypothetical protein [Streptomyces roseolus]